MQLFLILKAWRSGGNDRCVSESMPWSRCMRGNKCAFKPVTKFYTSSTVNGEHLRNNEWRTVVKAGSPWYLRSKSLNLKRWRVVSPMLYGLVGSLMTFSEHVALIAVFLSMLRLKRSTFLRFLFNNASWGIKSLPSVSGKSDLKYLWKCSGYVRDSESSTFNKVAHSQLG